MWTWPLIIFKDEFTIVPPCTDTNLLKLPAIPAALDKLRVRRR